MYNRVKAMVTLSIMVLCLTGCDARTSIVDIVTGEENDKQSAYESSSSVTDDTTSRNYEEQSEENSNETKTDSTEKDSMQSDSYSRDDSDTYDANQEEEKQMSRIPMKTKIGMMIVKMMTGMIITKMKSWIRLIANILFRIPIREELRTKI